MTAAKKKFFDAEFERFAKETGVSDFGSVGFMPDDLALIRCYWAGISDLYEAKRAGNAKKMEIIRAKTDNIIHGANGIKERIQKADKETLH